MVVMCKATRGVSCQYKLNSMTPEDISCVICGKNASPEECIFSNLIAKWEKSEGVFKLKEVTI